MGGHSSSGLFGPTSGMSRIESGKARRPPKSETPAPRAATGLKDHIAKGSGSGRRGINGCHEKSEFEKRLEREGGKVVEREPSKAIDGVEKVTYRLAKKDKTGEPTSELQERTYSKTLYDSSKISTDEYIRRGMEAAVNAKSTSGTQWEGTDSRGAKWIGYKNDNGEITTFFPAD